MKIKLKTILAGPKYRGQPGQTITVDDETGKQVITGGYAEEVKAEQPAAARKPAAPVKPPVAE